MSLAICISAISAGDLCMRHPRTTGAPLTTVALRHRLFQPVDREIAHRFLDADPALGQPALAQPCGDRRERIVILVPRQHVGGNAQAFAHRRFFEKGRDDRQFALAGQHRGGQSLAARPAHPGEIDQARSRLDQQRVHIVRAQQMGRLGEPRHPLRLADRNRLGGQIGESGGIGRPCRATAALRPVRPAPRCQEIAVVGSFHSPRALWR